MGAAPHGHTAVRSRPEQWDAETYDRRFGYVTALAASMLEWLDAKPGETVIDLGCGTGELTARIAETGAQVSGIDRDASMLEGARAKYPSLQFRLADGVSLSTPAPVDAVFSNAALHWMTDPDAVISAVWRALRPGGRFVAEFGAGANVSALIAGLREAVSAAGLVQPQLPWYFPTPAEYATRLEAGGFEIRRLEYFDRPTPLAPGDTAAAFWRMFGPSVLEQLPSGHVPDVLARIDALLAPSMVGPDGRWIADYARLRFLAVRAA